MEGELIALSAALGWAFSAVLTQPLTYRLRARFIQAVFMWMAALLSVVAALFAGRLTAAFHIPALPMTYFVLGALAGAAGDLTLILAISRGHVGRTLTVATSLLVLFSSVGSWVFLGESMAVHAWIGGALILLGVFLTNTPTDASEDDASTIVRGWARLLDPTVLAVATGILWASSLVLWDAGVQTTDPISGAAVANLAPAVVFGLWAARRSGGSAQPVGRRALLLLVVAGILYGGAILSATVSLAFSSAGLTAMLISSTPLFAVPLGAVLLQERPSRRVLAGMGVCVVGVAVVLASF